MEGLTGSTRFSQEAEGVRGKHGHKTLSWFPKARKGKERQSKASRL